jgi:adenylylsulfate kinase-like enzyme
MVQSSDGVASPRPWLVLVTGEPGSGKTTLGRKLAGDLRLPFLSRDEVRGGLLASAGMWTNQIHKQPDRDAARATFIDIAAGIAGVGVSSVLEFIPFRDSPGEMQRLTKVAECLVVLTTCAEAADRVDRRDRADVLLNREPVLAALGYESIDSYLANPQRETVRARMQEEFDLPLLCVRTDEAYDPHLEQILNWIIQQTDRRIPSAT